MNNATRNFLLTGIFAFGMGLLEAIVVVYLRQLYYPGGFAFPLVEFSPYLLKVELLREAATILMLLSVGILAGRSFNKSFAFFIYSFAVWDITYYFGLKILLAWPASLLTWDILFLIPIVWAGPVLAPLLCSLAMIVLSVAMVKSDEKRMKPVVSRFEWMLLITGSVIILLAFMRDYGLLLIRGNYLSRLSSLAADDSFHHAVAAYVPTWFNWYLFSAGMGLIVVAISRVTLRCCRSANSATSLSK